MNTRTAEVTTKFAKSDGELEDHDQKISEAYDILFRECGVESFLYSHKNNIGLVRANSG